MTEIQNLKSNHRLRRLTQILFNRRERRERKRNSGQLGVLVTHCSQNEFLRRLHALVHKVNCVALIFKLAEIVYLNGTSLR